MSTKKYYCIVTTIIMVLIVFKMDTVDGKVFRNCPLAYELVNQDFPRTFLTNWICLIDSESEKDTSRTTTKRDGSTSYGLFQINSKRWCKEGRKGGECDVDCQSLLSDNIAASARCAKHIWDKEGFKYWDGWVKKCKNNKNLPDISNCPDLLKPRVSPDRIRPNLLLPNNPIRVN